MRPLRVFLCHASQDKPTVWKLHRYLKQHGIKPWLDREDLLPGEDWEVEIPKALFASDVILVCLSKNSVNKEGFVQKEITYALDKAMEKPEGTIFIIPVKLEECEIPKRLSRYQWVNLFGTNGRKRLLMGLNKRVNELGPDISPVILEDTGRTEPKSHKTETQKLEEQIVSAPVKEDVKGEPEKEISTPPALSPLGSPTGVLRKGQGDGKNEGKQLPKKPFTKLLSPSSLAPERKNEKHTSAVSSKPIAKITGNRWIGIGGLIAIILLVIIFGGNYIANSISSATVTPTVMPSATLQPPTPDPTETEILSASTATPLSPIPTKVPSTSTAVSPTFTIVPTPLGGGGSIVFRFYGYQRNDSGIYIMQTNGNKTLIPGTSRDSNPSLSSDGKRLAVKTGDDEILIMNTDGSDRFQVTHNDYYDFSPTWSPDRRRIAFGSKREDNLGINYDIYAINVDGSNEIRLTTSTARDDDPAWSPDGTHIAFSRDYGDYSEICLIDMDGSNFIRLTDNGVQQGSPAWSPDGKYIAFTSNRNGKTEIYVMKADGSEQRNLTQNVSSDFHPSWSPDGNYIVFYSNLGNASEIFVIDIYGNNLVQLTNNSWMNYETDWAQ